MNRIRKLREEHDMTQPQLGEILNVQGAAISKYENEKIPLTKDTIETLANFFNVSTDYLLGISDDKTPIFEKKSNHTTPYLGGYDNKIRYWIDKKTNGDYAEVAQQLGIAEGLLVDYIDEKVAIPYHILSKLSNICEVSTDCLLGLNNKSRDLDFDNVLPFQYNHQIAERINDLRDPVVDSDTFLCALLCISEKELFYLTEYGFVLHVDVIIKLSEHFNVSIDYLLCRIDKQDEKILHTFKRLNEDNRDILIGKSKELLQNQRYDSSVAEDESEPKTGTYNQAK